MEGLYDARATCQSAFRASDTPSKRSASAAACRRQDRQGRRETAFGLCSARHQGAFRRLPGGRHPRAGAEAAARRPKILRCPWEALHYAARVRFHANCLRDAQGASHVHPHRAVKPSPMKRLPAASSRPRRAPWHRENRRRQRQWRAFGSASKGSGDAPHSNRNQTRHLRCTLPHPGPSTKR